MDKKEIDKFYHQLPMTSEWCNTTEILIEHDRTL